MHLPLTVYLDSSDFSKMSDPRRTAEEEAVRRRLVAWSRSSDVRFVFSGAHLMEMSPVEQIHSGGASRRADLLVELCGRSAVIAFERVLRAELGRLGDALTPLPDVLTSDGEWFPDWGNLAPSIDWLETSKTLGDAVKEQGLNREQRRKLQKTLFKRGRPTKATEALLGQREQDETYRQLLEQYPMRPEDAMVIQEYVRGKATRDQVNEAFLEGLRDPRWMMMWFAKHHSSLAPFTRLLREPGEKMLEFVRNLAAAARSARAMQEALGSDFQPRFLTREGREAFEETGVLRIVHRLLGDQEVSQDGLTLELVTERCPGLSVMLRTLLAASRDVTTMKPRVPMVSDFADGVHSVYAPYVDVFRTDAYMAPHVERHTRRFGVAVVPKLAKLPSVIEERLARRASQNS